MWQDHPFSQRTNTAKSGEVGVVGVGQYLKKGNRQFKGFLGSNILSQDEAGSTKVVQILYIKTTEVATKRFSIVTNFTIGDK